MPDQYGTPEMFPVPPKYRAPRPTNTERITWSSHRGPRETCAFCILDITAGTLSAPMATATQVAKKGDRKWHVCKQHALDIKQGKRRLP